MVGLHKNKNALNKFWKKFRRHHQLDFFSFLLQTELVYGTTNCAFQCFALLTFPDLCIHVRVEQFNQKLTLREMPPSCCCCCSGFSSLHEFQFSQSCIFMNKSKGAAAVVCIRHHVLRLPYVFRSSFSAFLVSLAIPRRSRRSRTFARRITFLYCDTQRHERNQYTDDGVAVCHLPEWKRRARMR